MVQKRKYIYNVALHLYLKNLVIDRLIQSKPMLFKDQLYIEPCAPTIIISWSPDQEIWRYSLGNICKTQGSR